jgi:hypothetical protein
MMMRQYTRVLRCSFQWVLILLTGIALVATWAYLGEARPFRLGILPDKGRHFGCRTCHIDPKGGGALNPFGKDYERIGIKAKETYTKALGDLDSDGDAFTNDYEFAAGTHPGLVTSKPEK